MSAQIINLQSFIEKKNSFSYSHNIYKEILTNYFCFPSTQTYYLPTYDSVFATNKNNVMYYRVI